MANSRKEKQSVKLDEYEADLEKIGERITVSGLDFILIDF